MVARAPVYVQATENNDMNRINSVRGVPPILWKDADTTLGSPQLACT
jgi:hypothetical protein